MVNFRNGNLGQLRCSLQTRGMHRMTPKATAPSLSVQILVPNAYLKWLLGADTSNIGYLGHLGSCNVMPKLQKEREAAKAEAAGFHLVARPHGFFRPYLPHSLHEALKTSSRVSKVLVCSIYHCPWSSNP